MCGIFGTYSFSGDQPDEERVRRMGTAIRHRGPDDFGMHVARRAVIGNARLSIIDVEGGHQPFVSADGQVAVVQNGEIYNYRELAAQLRDEGVALRSHCDTEVLLHLYLREGISFLERLNGMFAIAIWDGRTERLLLARDRIGVKPLFIGRANGEFYFASEIKSLLLAGCPRVLDQEALDHLLTFNYVPQPRTLFQDIAHLQPGCYAEIGSDGWRETRWWSLADQQPRDWSEEEASERFLDILEDAVRLRMRADVPYGAFLSGGVDSSSVVGLMSRCQDDAVRTFSIGFHDARFDESPFAQAAAERFATEHVCRKVDANMLGLWPLAVYHCDQPHGDVSFMPTFRVSQLAAEHVKVVLTGDGGDEIFAGYDKYRDFFADPALSDMDDAAFQARYFDSISLLDGAARKSLYGAELASIRTESPLELARAHFAEAGHFDRVNQALYLDMMLLLSGNNLVKPDRMGMAVSLEARTPFLDYRMMEFAFTLPGELKLRGGETKYLFKKAVTPLIGEELAYRKKQMFTVPVGEWFRTGTFLEEVLMDERTMARELFRPEAVRNMLGAHVAGTANHTRELRMLVALELWFRVFMDAEVPEQAPDWDALGLGHALAGLGPAG